uniref:Transposable element Tc3 transposase-like DNA-binding HTH domain-containing protein n=1 Tax=Caenorhabditis japonica TaxID=281687 RepID=A0A8R1I9G2_CAEJA
MANVLINASAIAGGSKMSWPLTWLKTAGISTKLLNKSWLADNGRVRGDDGWRIGRAGSGGPSNRCGGGEGGGGGNDRRVDDRHRGGGVAARNGYDNGRVRGDDGWRFGRAGSGGPSNRCGGGEGGEGGGGGNDRRVDDRHRGGGVAARNGYGEGGLDLRDERRRRPSPLATAVAAAAAFEMSGGGGRCLPEERRRRPLPSRETATAAVAARDNGEDDLRLRDKNGISIVESTYTEILGNSRLGGIRHFPYAVNYGQKHNEYSGRKRKASSRDERNVIRTACNSSTSLNEINTEPGIDVCPFFVPFFRNGRRSHTFQQDNAAINSSNSIKNLFAFKGIKVLDWPASARTSIRLRICGSFSFLVFIEMDHNKKLFKTSNLLCNVNGMLSAAVNQRNSLPLCRTEYNGRVRGDDGWRIGRAGSGGPSNRCGGGEGGGGGNDRRVDDRHSGGGVAARNGYENFENFLYVSRSLRKRGGYDHPSSIEVRSRD